MEDQLVYTVDEAAKVVGVHPQTLRAAIRRGEVPHVKIGRRIVIPRAALSAWLTDAAGKAVQVGG